MSAQNANPKHLFLDALHRTLGARMVDFAGYRMPVSYAGVIAEHHHCRSDKGAALFDVSHMGQVLLCDAEADRALETLVVGDICGLATGEGRYTLFSDPAGGICDDLIVTRRQGDLYAVVNAAVKDADIARLKSVTDVKVLEEQALLALQGPGAATVLAGFAPASRALAFMAGAAMNIAGAPAWVSRCGYTGEDGFEISVAAGHAEAVASALLEQPQVAPAGLGARDTLRLEAGLCLFGNDIDTTTTPIEAGLGWTIGKRRRERADFPGASIILDQLASGVRRKRVGIVFEGRAPVREGALLFDAHQNVPIGQVTSGGHAPTLGKPIAMGYLEKAFAIAGTRVTTQVRGRAIEGQVVRLPFVPHRFHRG